MSQSVRYDDAEAFLLSRIPELQIEFERLGITLIGKDAPYMVFGAFARWIADRCAEENTGDVDLVQRAFDAVEMLAKSEDPRTENLIRTGFLEALVQEQPDVLERARAHYGPRTSILDHEINAYWVEFHRDRPVFESVLSLRRDIKFTGVSIKTRYDLIDVAADLERTSEIRSWKITWTFPDGEAFQQVVSGQTVDTVLYQLASGLQSYIRNARKAQWPSCPRHPHALAAAIDEGKAVWVCPDDPLLAVAIGELEKLERLN